MTETTLKQPIKSIDVQALESLRDKLHVKLEILEAKDELIRSLVSDLEDMIDGDPECRSFNQCVEDEVELRLSKMEGYITPKTMEVE